MFVIYAEPIALMINGYEGLLGVSRFKNRRLGKRYLIGFDIICCVYIMF